MASHSILEHSTIGIVDVRQAVKVFEIDGSTNGIVETALPTPVSQNHPGFVRVTQVTTSFNSVTSFAL